MINAIAAIGKENRVIGNKGKIPWHISEDFKNFKEITTGHPIIMGRKTFESLPKILPDRTHIVITRDKDYKAPEKVLIVNSLEEALRFGKSIKGGEEIFIIGGGQIYEKSLPLVERLYLTLVDGEFEGDAFFPNYSEFKKEISRKESSDENHKYTFMVLEK